MGGPEPFPEGQTSARCKSRRKTPPRSPAACFKSRQKTPAHSICPQRTSADGQSVLRRLQVSTTLLLHARTCTGGECSSCMHTRDPHCAATPPAHLPRCQRTRGYRPSRRAPSTRGRRSRRSGCCRTSPTGRSHSARHWHWAVSAQRRPPTGPVPRCMVRAHAESGWNCSKRQQSAGGLPESALQHQAAAQPLLESFSSIPGCAHRVRGCGPRGGRVPGRRRCCRFCPNRSASRASFGRRCLSHPPAPPHARPRVRPRCLARVKCSSRWRSDATL